MNECFFSDFSSIALDYCYISTLQTLNVLPSGGSVRNWKLHSKKRYQGLTSVAIWIVHAVRIFFIVSFVVPKKNLDIIVLASLDKIQTHDKLFS